MMMRFAHWIGGQRLRTTLNIPEELIEEARRLLGFKSNSDVVVLALTELIRHQRIDALKSTLGSVDLDLGKSRRRARRDR